MAVMDYRTQDGLADYGFSIEYDPGRGWRVYIIFQPLHYSSHNEGMKLPHLAVDDNGRQYVNWPSKLESLGEAKTVAALWAELIQRHLASRGSTQIRRKAAISLLWLFSGCGEGAARCVR